VRDDSRGLAAAAHARGELGDVVHAEILACAKNGLIRIAEDGTLVLTDEGRRRAEKAGEEGQ
jgi:hypothetical protein